MTIKQVMERFRNLDPDKEIVILADGHAYELNMINDCINDGCVLIYGSPPKEKKEAI